MADTSVAITAGSGTAIDTRTEATNGNHRQVIVVGDPSTNAGVATVDATNGLSVSVTNASLAVTNSGITTIAGAVAGTEMQVDVVAALPAGTNAIGKLAANSGVDIGDVDVTTINGVAPAFGSGLRGATVQRVTIATDDVVPASQSGTWNVATLTTLTGGGVAHDGADSGNPVKIGAKASATLSDDTMVANGDRTDATSDLDGALLVRESFPLGDLISERTSNTDGTSTASTNFGATASTRNYVTGYSIFRTDAGTTPIYVDFRDGTAGSVLWSVVLPPNGGAHIASSVPLFCTTANTALAYDVSAATTTVYISVTGFKSKARA